MPQTKNAAPTALPPQADDAAVQTDAGQDAPTLTMEEVTDIQAATEVGTPVLAPPSEEAASAEQAITAWHTGVKVDGLWCNASARNAWALVAGIGWRRVAVANDSAFLTLTALLSHARQMGSSCNVRIESDNLIHEVYVW